MQYGEVTAFIPGITMEHARTLRGQNAEHRKYTANNTYSLPMRLTELTSVLLHGYFVSPAENVKSTHDIIKVKVHICGKWLAQSV
jgi:hypothetical protein